MIPILDDYGDIFEQFWTTRIYRSQLTVGGFSKPVSVSPLVNDNKYYNCGVTFNEDRTLMIFARCLRDSGKKLQCSLWRSDWKSGHWNKPQQLNRRINLPGTTTTQPNWVDAGDYSVLYFVSDRPRGFGELDIWYSIYQNNHFDDPINAGSVVNTPDNEITPFYDKNNGRLYFSSDGTHLTIGGYDVFYTEGALSKWTAPTNIGIPINSTANDIYFTVNRHDKGGYFASNRPKNPEDDADTCCTDLYHYQWLEREEVVDNKEDTIVTDTVSVQEKVTMLLPITLYFHNDEPDPRTTATTTTRNYRSTLADYIAMKDTYKTEYSRGLKGDDAEVARQRIERFFADSVERGFRKLEEFSQLLLTDLTAGNSVTITVCGFASPLHKAEYNYALSSRRIASFVNYLKEYKDFNEFKNKIRCQTTGDLEEEKPRLCPFGPDRRAPAPQCRRRLPGRGDLHAGGPDVRFDRQCVRFHDAPDERYDLLPPFRAAGGHPDCGGAGFERSSQAALCHR